MGYGLARFAIPSIKRAVVAIQSPTEEILLAMLMKLLSDHQLFVPEDVLNYILHRGERSFQAIYNIVESLNHASLAEKRKISIPLARQILETGGS